LPCLIIRQAHASTSFFAEKSVLSQAFDLGCFEMQFSKSDIALAEDSALMITSTIILVLFSTVVGFVFL